MNKSFFKTAAPYADDALNLPVEDINHAVSFYQNIMGFEVVSRSEVPHKSVILERDDVRIGLSENGGDPTQEGCFFEVDNVETAFAELKSNGLDREDPKFSVETFSGGFRYKVFFVIAPDGLCYCLGEPERK